MYLVWASLALSLLPWQPLLGGKDVKWMSSRYIIAAASSWRTSAFCCTEYVVNHVRIGANKTEPSPQSVAWMLVRVEIGLFHGCKAKAQQPWTSGLALRCILSAKMHPRQAATATTTTRWMTYYQLNTPWETSGHLQLTITAREARQCAILTFTLYK